MVSKHSRAADEDLVKLVLEGERAAFDELYERYINKVYAFAYRRIGSREEAENVTSQVFMKAFTGLAGFRGGSFGAWLYAIASREIADYWRERYKSEATVKELITAGPQATSSQSSGGESTGYASQPVDFKEDQSRAFEIIDEVLERLSESYRRVLELRFLEGLSLADTARVLETTESNVKVMQHRALKKAAEAGWSW